MVTSRINGIMAELIEVREDYENYKHMVEQVRLRLMDWHLDHRADINPHQEIENYAELIEELYDIVNTDMEWPPK